jgi:anti-sigma28 factor (negative regulator of flagellin synthesis)
MLSWRPQPPPSRWRKLKYAGKIFDTKAFDEDSGLGEEPMTVNNINNNETPGTSRLNLDQTSGSSRTTEASATNASAGAAGTGSDSISLTNSLHLVQQALTAGTSARAARVQQLKALVQSNQYNPSAQEISSALISAHLAGD